MNDGDFTIVLSLIGIALVVIIVVSTMAMHPDQVTRPFREPSHTSQTQDTH